jgi:hypothetical protein
MGVGIATNYGLDEPRSRSSSPGGVKNVHFSKSFRLALRSTQPPIQCAPGALSPGVKRPGREVDHSPPTSAEVKKSGSIHPLPYTPSWSSAYLVKHRDNFTVQVILVSSTEL